MAGCPTSCMLPLRLHLLYGYTCQDHSSMVLWFPLHAPPPLNHNLRPIAVFINFTPNIRKVRDFFFCSKANFQKYCWIVKWIFYLLDAKWVHSLSHPPCFQHHSQARTSLHEHSVMKSYATKWNAFRLVGSTAVHQVPIGSLLEAALSKAFYVGLFFIFIFAKLRELLRLQTLLNWKDQSLRLS